MVESYITTTLIIISVLFIFYIISLFNGLIRLRINIDKSWANIDVLLKQRHDELPNLINSVKGYMKHEKDVLESLTKARTSMFNTKNTAQKAAANDIISNSLKTIFAVSENYPQLRANENFKQLQERISELENQIADRREFYNDSTANFNMRIQSFPDLIIAKLMGYTKPRDMFQASDEEKRTTKIEM